MSQSFIMLKPESSLYIETILTELQNDGYSVNNSYLIKNYKSFARGIYYISNFIKDPKYYKIIEACIEAEILLFGNEALLIEVQNGQTLMEHLIHLDKVKSRIRKMISLSKSKTLQAFIDVDKLKIECPASTYGNIKILSDNQDLQEIYKANTETGNFVCFYLSYLHSIDANLDIYEKSIRFIQTSEHLQQLQNNEFEIIQKYKTYHI